MISISGKKWIERKVNKNLDDKDLVNLLEKDDTLAANIAAALIVTRFDIEKA